MPRRARRIFIIALLFSLLIHVLLLTGVRFTLPNNDDTQSSVIEARLMPLPVPDIKPVPLKPAPVKPASKPTRKPVRPQPHPLLLSPPAPLDMPAEPSAPLEPDMLPSSPDKPDAAASDHSADMPQGEGEVSVATPVLNTLPGKVEIQYRVVKGVDGFGIGKASYIWVTKDGRYTLTSITEGTGIFSLFQPGKLVQISQGKITAQGLAPDDFWIQRGRATPDKSTAVHFDYAHDTVSIIKNNQAFSAPLLENAQDLLSVVFQLALRAPFPDEMLLHVTTGKRLKPYHVKVIGEEIIPTAMGDLKVLHLSRPAEDDEDAMDIWLAQDYNFIPVKIRVNHSKYGVIEQLITGIQVN